MKTLKETIKYHQNIDDVTIAIENVCFKRHSRLMQSSYKESDAAKMILPYLEHLKTIWKNKPVLSFIRGLHEGFNADVMGDK